MKPTHQQRRWQDQFSPQIQSLLSQHTPSTPPTSSPSPPIRSTTTTTATASTDQSTSNRTTKTSFSTLNNNNNGNNKSVTETYNAHLPSWLTDIYTDIWTCKLQYNDKRNMINMRELMTRTIDVESPIWFFLPPQKSKPSSGKKLQKSDNDNKTKIKKKKKKKSDDDSVDDEEKENNDNSHQELYEESYRVACWSAIKREMYRLLKNDEKRRKKLNNKTSSVDHSDHSDSTDTTTTMNSSHDGDVSSQNQKTIFAYHNVAVLCFHLNQVDSSFQIMDMLIDYVFNVTFLRTIAYFYMQSDQLLNGAIVLHYLIRDSLQKLKKKVHREDNERSGDHVDDRSTVIDYHSIYLTMRLFSKHLIDRNERVESSSSIPNNNNNGHYNNHNTIEFMSFRQSVMQCLCYHKPNNHLYRLWFNKWNRDFTRMNNRSDNGDIDNEVDDHMDGDDQYFEPVNSRDDEKERINVKQLMKPREALYDTLQLLNQMLGKENEDEGENDDLGDDNGNGIEENDDSRLPMSPSSSTVATTTTMMPSITDIIRHQFYLNFESRSAKRKSMTRRCFGFLRNILVDYRILMRILGTIATIIGVTLFTKVVIRVFGAVNGRRKRWRSSGRRDDDGTMFQSILQSFYGSSSPSVLPSSSSPSSSASTGESALVDGQQKKGAGAMDLDFVHNNHNGGMDSDIKMLQVHHNTNDIGVNEFGGDDDDHMMEDDVINARVIIQPTHLTPKTTYKSSEEIENERVALSDFEYVDNLYREISDFSRGQLFTMQQQQQQQQKEEVKKQARAKTAHEQPKRSLPQVTTLVGSEGIVQDNNSDTSRTAMRLVQQQQRQAEQQATSVNNRKNASSTVGRRAPTAAARTRPGRTTATATTAPATSRNVKVFGRK